MNVHKFMNFIDEINFSIFMRIYNFMKFMRFMNVSILHFKGTEDAIAVARFKIIGPQGCPWIRGWVRVVAKVLFLRRRRRKEEASERDIMNLMNTYCFIVLMNT